MSVRLSPSFFTGVHIPVDAIGRYPSIRLATLMDESALTRFIEGFRWAVEVLRGS